MQSIPIVPSLSPKPHSVSHILSDHLRSNETGCALFLSFSGKMKQRPKNFWTVIFNWNFWGHKGLFCCPQSALIGPVSTVGLWAIRFVVALSYKNMKTLTVAGFCLHSQKLLFFGNRRQKLKCTKYWNIFPRTPTILPRETAE